MTERERSGAMLWRMEELIKLVSSKVGISEDQARSAVETVVSFLKAKLQKE